MAKKTKKAKGKTKKRKAKVATRKGARKAPARRPKTRRTKPDPCARERQILKSDSKSADDIRDFLPDAPATERPRLEEKLRRLEAKIRIDIQKLDECERLHPPPRK